jgi:hypothetical protein
MAAAQAACPDYRAPQGVWFVTWAAHTLMRGAVADRDTRTARQMADALRRIGLQLGSTRADALGNLGHAWADLLDGDLDNARKQQQEALASLVREGFALHVLDAVELGAAIGAAAGQDHIAAQVLAAVTTERKRAGLVRVPPEHSYWDGITAYLRERLGPREYAAARHAGESMPFSEATSRASGR